MGLIAAKLYTESWTNPEGMDQEDKWPQNRWPMKLLPKDGKKTSNRKKRARPRSVIEPTIEDEEWEKRDIDPERDGDAIPSPSHVRR